MADLEIPVPLAGDPAEEVRGRVVRVARPAWEAPEVAGGAVAADGAVAEEDAGRPVNEEEYMKSHLRSTAVPFVLVILLGALSTTLILPGWARAASGKAASSATTARAFNTPKEAAEALIGAAGTYDVSALLEIFGPDGKDFIASEDPIHDKSIAANFAAKAREKNVVEIDPQNKLRAVLSIGSDDWPFPVPIVKKDSKWYFDAKQGRDEILFRRIGANELDAIQICRGFVEAEKEYASVIHDNSGINQYAQKIISTPGKHDGLYWKNDDGTSGGPISEAIARAIEEGYSTGKASGYHGYYFKVLTGQGPAAKLGQLDYLIEGAMIGGFALVAFPAEYRVTGVKSFMVSYDGVVHEKDLGPETTTIARGMERYNPDKTWRPTNDEWPEDSSVGSE